MYRNADYYGSMIDFCEKNIGQTFRYWVRKEIFTPYEQDQRFEHQSVYENEVCSFGELIDVIPLTNGDCLLGLGDSKYKEYYKLSQIHLAWSEQDQND